MKFLTLIPAYNEEATLEALVEKTLSYGPVCVVDDASKDKTPEILARLKTQHGDKLHIIRHEKNTHISKGLREGMQYALEQGMDYVVAIDAGNSHDPAAIPDFVAHSACDLLIGSRTKTEGVPLYRKCISKGAAFAINYCLSDSLFNLRGPKIKDCTSGYRRYSKKAMEVILNAKVTSVAHEFNMEALYLIYSAGLRVEEIGITYQFSNSSLNRKILERGINLAFNLFTQKVSR